MSATKKNIFWFAFLATLVFATGFFFFIATANANPLQYTNTTQTSAATSTGAFQTPGTATSTVVADTYQVSTGNNYANNTTELLWQLSASSTASQGNLNLEYSNGYPGVDCVTTQSACDWYQDTITNQPSVSTTSPTISLNTVVQYNWKFASSTVGQGAVSATNNRDTRALRITVPTRYVRAIVACAPGGANCTQWLQFVPAKEVK